MASVWGKLRSIIRGRLCYYNREESSGKKRNLRESSRWQIGDADWAFTVGPKQSIPGILPRTACWSGLTVVITINNSNEFSFLLCLCFPIII